MFQDPHLQYGLPPMGQPGMKRSAEGAGLDMMEPPSSDEDSSEQKPQIHSPHHDQYEDHEGWEKKIIFWDPPEANTVNKYSGRTPPVLAGVSPMDLPPPTTGRRQKDGWASFIFFPVLSSNDNNPLLQGEDQNGVHRQQVETVHHLLQEKDWHYEEGEWECYSVGKKTMSAVLFLAATKMKQGTKISVSN